MVLMKQAETNNSVIVSWSYKLFDRHKQKFLLLCALTIKNKVKVTSKSLNAKGKKF